MAVLTGYGIPQDEIVKLVINPATDRPISEVTLREEFRVEIDQGAVRANAKVVGGMFKNATTATPLYPGGNPTLQIWWTKARMRWRGSDYGDEVPPPPAPDDHNRLEMARRIHFALRSLPPKARAALLARPVKQPA